MTFNAFIWGLYKNSPDGKSEISKYSNLNRERLENDFNAQGVVLTFDKPEDQEQFGTEPITFYPIEGIRDLALKHEVKSMSGAERLFTEIVDKGLPFFRMDANGVEQEFKRIGAQGERYEGVIEFIDAISLGLYWAYPNYFVPYFYVNGFDELEEICTEFAIPIPPVPGKTKWRDRALYYFRLNEAFIEFAKLNDLSPPELCAFLYDFAPQMMKEQRGELPAPSKAWLITGGAGNNGDFEFLEESDENTTSHWQGNTDTRRGDILLMYVTSPHSRIHSIWRASSDGFYDPFFYFHNTVRIKSPIHTKPVTFKEMKADPVLSKMGAVRANLQGPSGKPFTVEEYQAVLDIMARKGQNIDILPKVETTTFIPDIDLADERDVEVRLIEPFLKRMGYTEKDWVRQMRVSMGRRERYYPDYAFGAKTKKGEESAEMVLEAKHHIQTRRALTDAYYQAKSYAYRLQATKIVLCAVEGVWAYDGKNGYDHERFVHRNWKELENPDVLHEMRKLIGK